MEIRYLLKALCLPPFIQIIFLLLALLCRKRIPRLSRLVCWLSVFSLWALATPLLSTKLALSLEQDRAIQPNQITQMQVDAIVVLSGRQNETAPEFGEAVSGEDQLSRIRYAAFLKRRSGLPVLLSGGSVRGDEHRSLAETMAFDLKEGFGFKAKWLESKSRTTAENAKFSYAILDRENKRSIALVTSSLHMKRAKWSFEHAGFEVLPAPTGFLDIKPLNMNSFIPNANSLLLSSNAFHEWLGYWVYRMLA